MRISQKLDVLRSEELSLKEEMALNEQLGAEVGAMVKASPAKPSEVLKFKLHVEEIDKITSLLLGLSTRLARTENALNFISSSSSCSSSVSTPDNNKTLATQQEKDVLELKRSKLLDQLDEAKRLKESIDRRSLNVSQFLANYLNEESYEDYQHFVKMKSKLIMDSREISDKIKLGEEQIKALQESMTQSSNAAANSSPSPPPPPASSLVNQSLRKRINNTVQVANAIASSPDLHSIST